MSLESEIYDEFPNKFSANLGSFSSYSNSVPGSTTVSSC